MLYIYIYTHIYIYIYNLVFSPGFCIKPQAFAQWNAVKKAVWGVAFSNCLVCLRHLARTNGSYAASDLKPGLCAVVVVQVHDIELLTFNEADVPRVLGPILHLLLARHH